MDVERHPHSIYTHGRMGIVQVCAVRRIVSRADVHPEAAEREAFFDAFGGGRAGGPGAALGWIEADRFKISDHDRTVVVAERPPESEVARPLTPRRRLRALGLTKRPAAANDAAWPSVLAPAGCGVWSRS